MIIDDTKTPCITRTNMYGLYADACRVITIYPPQDYPYMNYVEIRIYRSAEGYAQETTAMMPIDIRHRNTCGTMSPHFATPLEAITCAVATLRERYHKPEHAKVLCRYLTALHNHLAAERQQTLF